MTNSGAIAACFAKTHDLVRREKKRKRESNGYSELIRIVQAEAKEHDRNMNVIKVIISLI